MAPVSADIILADNWWPNEPRCKRCGERFWKNRKDKLYCSPQCQDPARYVTPNLEGLKQTNRDLVALDDRPSMAELTKAFELATGVPFAVRLTSRPRRLRYRSDPEELREEQGHTWWNVGSEVRGEPEPADVENRLRARELTKAEPAGETPEQWLARGGQIRVLPPGNAFIV